jgi:sirohydrochlorin cobaltochelatase
VPLTLVGDGQHSHEHHEHQAHHHPPYPHANHPLGPLSLKRAEPG